MGQHQSTGAVQDILEYRDAVARFDPEEQAMLQKAFKKYGGNTVDKLTFVRNALSMVPEPLQTRMYQVFGGGSRGIGLHDAVCGLCIFLKGTVEEKKQLVFKVYDVDDVDYLTQSRLLTMIVPGDDRRAIVEGFPKGARVEFAAFDEWARRNPEATGLIQWMDFPPPSPFTQTTVPSDIAMLAEISGLKTAQAKALQSRYYDLRNTLYIRGHKFTAKALRPLACPPVTPAVLARLCYLWGDDRGGEVAFREVLQGVSVCCRGTPAQLLGLLFKIFDIGGKGHLDHSNMRMLLVVADELKHVKTRVQAPRERTLSAASVTSKDEFEDDATACSADDDLDELPPGSDPFEVGPDDSGIDEVIDSIFVRTDDGKGLTLDQFSEWAGTAAATINAIKRPLAFLGHTVFAFRPATLAEEGRVVAGQMRLDTSTGALRKHGNQCCLLSRTWYDAWRVHVGLDAVPPGVRPETPGPIDNSSLLTKPASIMEKTLSYSKRSFTSRGLRKGLEEDRDFVVVSEVAWAMLALWYSGEPLISRPIIARDSGTARIELYPLSVRVFQHVASKHNDKKESGDAKKDKGPTINFLLLTECSRTQTIKQLARSICMQQRGMKRGNPQLKASSVRLWDYDDPAKPRLLEPEWEAGELQDGQAILLEVRNKDLSWPSELHLLMASSKRGKAPVETVFGATVKRESGATGLSNLGNTCFLNAAVQCLSNTEILREYFLRKCYRAEINRTNVLGSKGAIAAAHSQLVQRLWCGKTSVAPVRLRETVIKHAPQFQGYEQHDSQEFLNFVIDALHEDLNRVVKPPYVERQDSNLRPDHIVAAESWEGHQKRNRSVIVDLLHGQLKSTLRCKECQFTSVSFDPFTFLTLPLPTENETVVDIKLTRQKGGVPDVFSVGVQQGGTFACVKQKFVDLINADPGCNSIEAESIIFVEFPGTASQRLIDDRQKMRQMKGNLLYAYEIQSGVQLHASGDTSTHTSDERPMDDAEADSTSNPSRPEETSNVAQSEASTASSSRRSSPDAGARAPTRAELAAEEAKRFTIPGHVFAVHRKKESLATHFLTQPHHHQIFGSPILVPVDVLGTNAAIYDYVWAQVSHFLVPEFRASVDMSRDFPFQLTQLGKVRVSCDPRKCSWARYCTGCVIPNSDDAFHGNMDFIGIDWKPREYCLYFDASQDTRFNLHKSVEVMKAKEKEPIELADCLKAFTKEEDMGKDDLWYCPKCKEHREATKKLDIWSLPPVLIIHLKRFHMLNARWVKSQRHVNFAVSGLDVYSHLENHPTYVSENADTGPAAADSSVETSSQKSSTVDEHAQAAEISNFPVPDNSEPSTCEGKDAVTNLKDDVAVIGDTTDGSRQNVLDQGCTVIPNIEKLDPHAHFYSDPSGPRVYDLTSMTIHLGIMGGGHYVSYAKNPNGKWYYYNDSSCKAVPVERVAREDGYCLFYTARGIDMEKILPKAGHDLDGIGSDQDDDDDDGKARQNGPCVIS